MSCYHCILFGLGSWYSAPHIRECLPSSVSPLGTGQNCAPPSLPAKLTMKANSLQGKARVLNGRQRMDHQCEAFLLGKVPGVGGRKRNPQLSIFIQLVLVIDV